MTRALVLALAVLALALPAAAAAFDNTEPYAAQEWYLALDNAWSFWPTAPQL